MDLILDGPQLAWIDERLPPSVRLVDAIDQAEGVTGMSAAFELNLTAMSLLALLVGMFLIYNAMTFATVQRATCLATARRWRTPGITTLVLGEALVLGVIGTLIGILLDILLGRGLTGIVAATVSALYYGRRRPASASTRSLLWPGASVAGTLLATWLPARQAAEPAADDAFPLRVGDGGTASAALRAGLGMLLVGLIAMTLPGGVTGFAGYSCCWSAPRSRRRCC